MGYGDTWDDGGYAAREAQGLNFDWDEQELARRVTRITDRFEELRAAPGFVMSLAREPIPDAQLLKAIRKSQYFKAAHSERRRLEAMPDDEQRRQWAMAGRRTQALIRQAGYQVPEEDNRGFFERRGGPVGKYVLQPTYDATEDVGDKLHTWRYGPDHEEKLDRGLEKAGAVASAIPGAGLVKDAVSTAFSNIQTIGGFFPHVYRFTHAVNERTGPKTWGGRGDDWGDDFGDYLEAWEDAGAKRGEGYFPDEVHAEVRKILRGDPFAQQFAVAMASGEDPDEIASKYAKPGTPKYQRIYTAVIERARNKDFQNALQVLEFGKVSPGRDIAKIFGLKPNDVRIHVPGYTDFDLYHMVSGSVDLTYTLLFDPFLIGGKAMKAYRLSRPGVVNAAMSPADAMAQARAVEEGRLMANLGVNSTEELAARLATMTPREILNAGKLGWRHPIRGARAVSDSIAGMYTWGQTGQSSGAGRHALVKVITDAIEDGGFKIEAGTGRYIGRLQRAVETTPALRRAMPAIQQWHAAKAAASKGAWQQLLGRNLTETEVAEGIIRARNAAEEAILGGATKNTGMNTADDVWEFFTHVPSHDGATRSLFSQSFLQGEWGGIIGRSEMHAPRITTFGQNRAAIWDALRSGTNTLAYGQRSTYALGKNEMLIDNVIEEVEPYVLDAMGPVRKGYKRLYRVQLRDGLGNSGLRDLPTHIDPEIAKAYGISTVWTESVEHARDLSRSFGPTGRLYVVDVPDNQVTKLVDHLAKKPGMEWVIPPWQERRSRALGDVGQWVEKREPWGFGLEHIRHYLLAPPSHLALSLARRVPETTVIGNYGAAQVKTFQQVMDMGVSLPAQRIWMNELYRQAGTNPMLRWNMVQNAIDHMFAVNGLYDQGADAIAEAKRYLEGTRQAFASNGKDIITTGGSITKVGIGPVIHHADGFRVPDLRMVMAQTQRMTMMRSFFNGVNRPWVDAMMGTYWKPSVLMRIGFVPRVAGEELLGVILRTPEVLKDSWLLRPIAIRQGEDFALFKPIIRAANYMRSLVPEGSHRANALTQLAEFLHARSVYMRGLAFEALGPEARESLEAYLSLEFVRTSVADNIIQVGGRGAAEGAGLYEGPLALGRPGLLEVPLDPEDPSKVRLLYVDKSNRVLRKREDPLFNAQFASLLDDATDEPTYMAAFAAGSIYANPAEVVALRAWMRDNDSTEIQALYELAGGDADDVIRVIREAIDRNGLRAQLRRYENAMEPLPDLPRTPEKVARVQRRRAALKEMDRLATDDAGKLVVKVWDDLPDEFRDMLLVDEGYVRRLLGAVDEPSDEVLERALQGLDEVEEGRERLWIAAPAHPGDLLEHGMSDRLQWATSPRAALQTGYAGQPASAGSQLFYRDFLPAELNTYLPKRVPDQAGIMLEPNLQRVAASEVRLLDDFQVQGALRPEHAATVNRLIEDARAGSTAARHQLAVMAARQSIDNLAGDPLAARYIRESRRSIQTRSGQTAVWAPPEGHTPVYTIIASDAGAQRVLQLDPAVAQPVLGSPVDGAQFRLEMADKHMYGLPEYQPITTWSTTSRSEAQDYLRAMGGGEHGDLALGRIDVPDERMNTIYRSGLSTNEMASVAPAAVGENVELMARNDELVSAWRSVRADKARRRAETARQAERDAARAAQRAAGEEDLAAETAAVVARGEAPSINLKDLSADDARDLMTDLARFPSHHLARENLERALAEMDEGDYELAQRMVDGLMQSLRGRIARGPDALDPDLYDDAVDLMRKWAPAETESREIAEQLERAARNEANEIAQLDQQQFLETATEGDVRAQLEADGFSPTEVDAYMQALRSGPRDAAARLEGQDLQGSLDAMSESARDRAYRVAADERTLAEAGFDINDPDTARWLDTMSNPDQMDELAKAHREYERAAVRAQEAASTGEGQIEAHDALVRAEHDMLAFGFDMNDKADAERIYSIMKARPRDFLDEAYDDWAQTIVSASDELTISPRDGRFVHALGGRARRKGYFKIEDVAHSPVARDHMPGGLMAPQLIDYDPNLWERGVQTVFDYFNRWIAALVREPLYIHHFSQRFPAARNALRQHFEDPETYKAALSVMTRTPGRQADVIRTYRSIMQGVMESVPDLGRAMMHGNYDEIVEIWSDPIVRETVSQAISGMTVPGVNARLADEVIGHVNGFTGVEIDTMAKWMKNQTEVDRMAATAASRGAVEDVIPQIDNHKVKSQYADNMRNLQPFFFAQEQMLKRWAKTFIAHPAALRRAQLLFMGAQHAGVIRENDYGDKVWVMPLSGAGQQAIGGLGKLITGESWAMPTAVPFTGEVKYTIPGVSNPLAPSVGPLVTIPLNQMSRHFPEIGYWQTNVFGEETQGKSFIGEFVPVSVRRIYDAAFANNENSSQYASAMISAMQYLASEGYAPVQGDPDYEDQKRRFIERVKNWTRTMLVFRALYGFVMPAPPQNEFPGDYAPELQKLLRNLPYEEAIAQFLKDNPDATAYTIFGTASESGAAMPATKTVGAFLDDHGDFVRKYPLAVPWMLPQSDAEEPTGRQVFQQQMQMGLRHRKAPEEWIEDYAFAEGVEGYFESKEIYDRDRLRLPTSQQRAALDDDWRTWKAAYFEQYPVFADRYQSREGQMRRQGVLRQMQLALNDKSLPRDSIPFVDEIELMMTSYQRFRSDYDALVGDRRAWATSERNRLQVAFTQWGRDFVAAYPALTAFWYGTMQREIGLDAADELTLERSQG
ncbi:MAG: hypothetical protein FJ038_03905 [Chloroflexi bacterium]|nr:hypothetical protein [Chloroflexota bacterium]